MDEYNAIIAQRRCICTNTHVYNRKSQLFTNTPIDIDKEFDEEITETDIIQNVYTVCV